MNIHLSERQRKAALVKKVLATLEELRDAYKDWLDQGRPVVKAVATRRWSYSLEDQIFFIAMINSFYNNEN